MKIQKDSAVQIHYHLTDGDGEVIDSSKGNDPLAYLHGHGNLVPGVESVLIGKSAGDTLSTVVSPEEGYGVRDEGLDVAVPLQAFPEEVRTQLQVGEMFQGPHPTEEGGSAVFRIVVIEGDRILASANHPLAGVELHFDLEVVDVRAATEEELTHGHIHGPGGHHH